MSTYDVTTNPSQIQIGRQDSVTLYNNGSNTIYLDSDASVSVYNGFPLFPTGQMTWKGHVPLFAVTGLGKSQLRVHRSGGISDTSRASFDASVKVTTTKATAPYNSGMCEVGAYQSLAMSITVPFDMTPQFPSATYLEQIIYVKWYDDDQRFLETEVVNYWVGPGGVTFLRIPTKSRYVQISTPGSTLYNINSVINLLGSSRVIKQLSSSVLTNAGDGALAVRTTQAFFTLARRSLTVTQWLPSLNGFLLLPSYGNELCISLRVAAGNTLAGAFELYNLGLGVSYGLIEYSANTTLKTYIQNLTVPTSENLALALVGAVATAPNTAYNFSLVWKE